MSYPQAKPRLTCLLFLALLLLSGSAQARGTPPAEELPPARLGPPRSMAVLGDSMTTAALSSRLERNQWENSWATGGSEQVQSHWRRLRSALASGEVRAFNAAVSGERMRHLEAQAWRVVAEAPEYVAILMGANDACAQREQEMTSVEDFRAQFAAAMDTLTRGLPDARIYVVSVPDVRRLYDLYSENLLAHLVWGLAKFCPTMLGHPGSTAGSDEARRQRVRERIRDYNRQLEEVCAEHLRCRFDGNALFSYAFTARDVSDLDYFHPSRHGQRQIAALTWSAGFDFSDATPPRTTAQATRTVQGVQVELTAADEAGVRGVEVRRTGGPWQRHAGPLLLGPGERLAFRAVDVNGNVEAAQALDADSVPALPPPRSPSPGQVFPVPTPRSSSVDTAPEEGGCTAAGSGPGGCAAWSALAALLAALARRGRGWAIPPEG